MDELDKQLLARLEWLHVNAEERDALRKQLDIAEKRLRFTDELLDDWFDNSGEYLSPLAIREQITYIKSEIEKVKDE